MKNSSYHQVTYDFDSKKNLLNRSKVNSIDASKILCEHCLRTKTNGIRCKGMCVADDEY